MGILLLGLIALAAPFSLATGKAEASRPDLLWQSPSDLTAGAGAGQMEGVRGIAASPVTGNVFVADRTNHRIDELTAYGEFVGAWGWGVRDGSAELQVCGPEAGAAMRECRQGVAGTGPGQLSSPVGVAVGDEGSVFVYEDEEQTTGDLQNFRVQKFTPDGAFELMFGGDVNKTKAAEAGTSEAERNLCIAASGDECGIGVPGTGQGEFSNRTDADPIDVGPSGTVFVGDAGRIEAFSPDGIYQGEVTGSLVGESVRVLTTDDAGNFYVALQEGFMGTKPGVRKLTSTGAQTSIFEPRNPGYPVNEQNFTGLAVDDQNDIFAIVQFTPIKGGGPRIVEFAPDGDELIPDGSEAEEREKAKSEEGRLIPAFAEARPGTTVQRFLGLATSGACGITGSDVYLASEYGRDGEAYVTSYGPPPDPDQCPPPAVAPTIAEQYVVAATPDGATLKAKINPHFWLDAGYYVEYGTGRCSEGGCDARTGEELLGEVAANRPLSSKGVSLGGLAPATTYHFRFVASSSGGGPSVGVGQEQAEAAFTTPDKQATPAAGCPNENLRQGVSALLEDCRAYEQVSPAEKGNGDILTLAEAQSNPAAYDQAAAGGERVSYSTYRAFGDAVSAPYTSQYIALRGSSGWESEGISPPRGISLIHAAGLDGEYRLFSEDLCKGWLFHESDPSLGPGALAGFANLYERSTCGPVSYRGLSPNEPSCHTAAGYVPDLQGVAADEEHVVFRVTDKLTEDANECSTTIEGSNYQCYESSPGGPLRLVSVLPSGVASSGRCSIGTETTEAVARFTTAQGAISENGERVYWTEGARNRREGTIYVRVNATAEQSAIIAGHCTEPTKACTVKVGAGRYWAASPTGSVAYFTTVGGDLREFDLREEATSTIAGEVAGVVGTSRDADRIYFVSREARAAGAQAGRPNLYLYEGGSFTYVATVADRDVEYADRPNTFPSLANSAPFMHTARVSPDGTHVAFDSTAALTGAENIDSNSGEPDGEVFVFDADSGKLNCASCLATGVRPSGRELRPAASAAGGFATGLWAASQIPGYPGQLYASRLLSENGKRLFFESFQALVPRDTNGKQDVYEWEAPGEGTCSTSGASYRPANGGCISLITSGASPTDSEFVDASKSGSDVFFTTGESLVAGDSGLIDVYDARVDGGYPPAPAPTPACQGEACQGEATAPGNLTTPSASYVGPGNLKQSSRKKRCPKGKAKRKGRCVKKRHRRHRGHHHARRQAGTDTVKRHRSAPQVSRQQHKAGRAGR